MQSSELRLVVVVVDSVILPDSWYSAFSGDVLHFLPMKTDRGAHMLLVLKLEPWRHPIYLVPHGPLD